MPATTIRSACGSTSRPRSIGFGGAADERCCNGSAWPEARSRVRSLSSGTASRTAVARSCSCSTTCTWSPTATAWRRSTSPSRISQRASTSSPSRAPIQHSRSGAFAPPGTWSNCGPASWRSRLRKRVNCSSNTAISTWMPRRSSCCAREPRAGPPRSFWPGSGCVAMPILIARCARSAESNASWLSTSLRRRWVHSPSTNARSCSARARSDASPRPCATTCSDAMTRPRCWPT